MDQEQRKTLVEFVDVYCKNKAISSYLRLIGRDNNKTPNRLQNIFFDRDQNYIFAM